MGLDMYAFKTKIKPEKEIDFLIPKERAIEFFYWRKHYALSGWFDELYEKKGGVQEFNRVHLQLNSEDIDNLEKYVKEISVELKDRYDMQEDIDFIAKSRTALSEGYTVYYRPSW